MTVEGALELLRNAVLVTAWLSGPVIFTALVVGVLIGVMQTVVQVNEASLSFVVKLLAVCACLAFLGPRLLARTIDYTKTTIGSIADVVK
jgi:flagellar biosynthetic protein FliQ